MRDVIENLSNQHRALTQVAMDLVPLLDGDQLAEDATAARRCVHSLAGILRVHLAMEDESFYPSLLEHRDPELRRKATRYLADREVIRQRFTEWNDRWRGAGAIETAAYRFIEQTRAMLRLLGKRMVEQDPSSTPRWSARGRPARSSGAPT